MIEGGFFRRDELLQVNGLIPSFAYTFSQILANAGITRQMAVNIPEVVRPALKAYDIPDDQIQFLINYLYSLS